MRIILIQSNAVELLIRQIRAARVDMLCRGLVANVPSNLEIKFGGPKFKPPATGVLNNHAFVA